MLDYKHERVLSRKVKWRKKRAVQMSSAFKYSSILFSIPPQSYHNSFSASMSFIILIENIFYDVFVIETEYFLDNWRFCLLSVER